jgi:hypothetical protein
MLTSDGEIINIGPIEFSAALHQMDDRNLVMTLLACDNERFFDLSKSDSGLFSALCVFPLRAHKATQHIDTVFSVAYHFSRQSKYDVAYSFRNKYSLHVYYYT